MKGFVLWLRFFQKEAEDRSYTMQISWREEMMASATDI